MNDSKSLIVSGALVRPVPQWALCWPSETILRVRNPAKIMAALPTISRIAISAIRFIYCADIDFCLHRQFA